MKRMLMNAQKILNDFIRCYGLEYDYTIQLAQAYDFFVSCPTKMTYQVFMRRYFNINFKIAMEEEG